MDPPRHLKVFQLIFFFFSSGSLPRKTETCDDIMKDWDNDIMYSLLIIFSPLLNTLPAAWLQCAMTPRVWHCHCPSSTSKECVKPRAQSSSQEWNPVLHVLYIWFAVNFDLCFGTCAALCWHFGIFFFFFFQAPYETELLFYRNGYFEVDINI